MNDAKDNLAITDVMLELAGLYGRSPGYQEIWKEIISARIPAHRVGYRWRIRREDIPAIAASFGLTSADRAA